MPPAQKLCYVNHITGFFFFKTVLKQLITEEYVVEVKLLDLDDSFIIGRCEFMWDARGDVDFFGWVDIEQ